AERANGKRITANMYTYLAGATGLDASFPPWVQSGGLEAWIKRLKDPATRARVEREMKTPQSDWENLMLLAGSPDKILLIGFKNDKLKPLTGKTLAEVARMRGKSPEQTAMDLVIEDGSRVGTAYFLMSDTNVKREVGLPWMSFGSDEGSPATIQDHATYAKPAQLATGVVDVFVNGVQVLKDGKHTGAKPGRVVRGPGWTGWPGGGACH